MEEEEEVQKELEGKEKIIKQDQPIRSLALRRKKERNERQGRKRMDGGGRRKRKRRKKYTNPTTEPSRVRSREMFN